MSRLHTDNKCMTFYKSFKLQIIHSLQKSQSKSSLANLSENNLLTLLKKEYKKRTKITQLELIKNHFLC